jgi:hypothetical protein
VPAHVALSARCETGARGQRERRRRPQGDDQKARLATRCDDGYLRDVFKRGGGGWRWGCAGCRCTLLDALGSRRAVVELATRAKSLATTRDGFPIAYRVWYRNLRCESLTGPVPARLHLLSPA